MKQFLLFLFGGFYFTVTTNAQITTPVIRAAFGVDGDLRTNYFNGFIQSGNDDWFNNGTLGTGNYVIDTTGAAAIVAGYLSDVSPWPRRMAPIYRSMRVPPFTVVNNRLWLDALWVRDYHGFDTTVFSAGSNKNGMSPVQWSSPPSQAIPDKNDILDMFMHVRRAGPTVNDSLWLFAGLSLDNVTGNRYFDFELYQTDIYFDRPSGKWYGYGPDMGHTTWEFDAAGNVTKAGDVIFSAKFQSSTLTELEARIWVHQSSLSLTPTQFSWSGKFDGDGNNATFGYASILPNTSGIFYTGLGCNINTYAGPFRIVLQDNSISTNYIKDQFMEFSVNLSKLGLDPSILFGSDICGSPFNRVVVKTRASESFTAELKDFVAPMDLFLAPRANVAAEVPIFCADSSTSLIQVLNPLPTSIYNWSTTDGNIITPVNSTWIQVNSPGTYIVEQLLMIGCNPYASDSAFVIRDIDCFVLAGKFKSFSGNYIENEKRTNLRWSVLNNSSVKSFIVEKSIDGMNFKEAGLVFANNTLQETSYEFTHNITDPVSSKIEYRIKMINKDGTFSYSRIIYFGKKTDTKVNFLISPNPVRNKFQVSVTSNVENSGKLIFLDMQGRPVMSLEQQIKKGVNVFSVAVGDNWQPGVYFAILKINQDAYNTRFIVLE